MAGMRVPWVDEIRPMLAGARKQPFSSSEWIYEIKYDGYRCLAGVDHGRVELRTRNGANCTHWYEEVALLLSTLKGGPHVIDGEAAVLDDIGRSDFNRLHKRAAKRGWDPANPVTFCAFDLLVVNGKNLMDQPLEVRKDKLFRLLKPLQGKLIVIGDWPAETEIFREFVLGLKLEGVVAKQRGSVYSPGIVSPCWLKIKRPGWNEGRTWKK